MKIYIDNVEQTVQQDNTVQITGLEIGYHKLKVVQEENDEFTFVQWSDNNGTLSDDTEFSINIDRSETNISIITVPKPTDETHCIVRVSFLRFKDLTFVDNNNDQTQLDSGTCKFYDTSDNLLQSSFDSQTGIYSVEINSESTVKIVYKNQNYKLNGFDFKGWNIIQNGTSLERYSNDTTGTIAFTAPQGDSCVTLEPDFEKQNLVECHVDFEETAFGFAEIMASYVENGTDCTMRQDFDVVSGTKVKFSVLFTNAQNAAGQYWSNDGMHALDHWLINGQKYSGQTIEIDVVDDIKVSCVFKNNYCNIYYREEFYNADNTPVDEYSVGNYTVYGNMPNQNTQGAEALNVVQIDGHYWNKTIVKNLHHGYAAQTTLMNVPITKPDKWHVHMTNVAKKIGDGAYQNCNTEGLSDGMPVYIEQDDNGVYQDQFIVVRYKRLQQNSLTLSVDVASVYVNGYQYTGKELGECSIIKDGQYGSFNAEIRATPKQINGYTVEFDRWMYSYDDKYNEIQPGIFTADGNTLSFTLDHNTKCLACFKMTDNSTGIVYYTQQRIQRVEPFIDNIETYCNSITATMFFKSESGFLPDPRTMPAECGLLISKMAHPRLKDAIDLDNETGTIGIVYKKRVENDLTVDMFDDLQKEGDIFVYRLSIPVSIDLLDESCMYFLRPYIKNSKSIVYGAETMVYTDIDYLKEQGEVSSGLFQVQDVSLVMKNAQRVYPQMLGGVDNGELIGYSDKEDDGPLYEGTVYRIGSHIRFTNGNLYYQRDESNSAFGAETQNGMMGEFGIFGHQYDITEYNNDTVSLESIFPRDLNDRVKLDLFGWGTSGHSYRGREFSKIYNIFNYPWCLTNLDVKTFLQSDDQSIAGIKYEYDLIMQQKDRYISTPGFGGYDDFGTQIGNNYNFTLYGTGYGAPTKVISGSNGIGIKNDIYGRTMLFGGSVYKGRNSAVQYTYLSDEIVDRADTYTSRFDDWGVWNFGNKNYRTIREEFDYIMEHNTHFECEIINNGQIINNVQIEETGLMVIPSNWKDKYIEILDDDFNISFTPDQYKITFSDTTAGRILAQFTKDDIDKLTKFGILFLPYGGRRINESIVGRYNENQILNTKGYYWTASREIYNGKYYPKDMLQDFNSEGSTNGQENTMHYHPSCGKFVRLIQDYMPVQIIEYNDLSVMPDYMQMSDPAIDFENVKGKACVDVRVVSIKDETSQTFDNGNDSGYNWRNIWYECNTSVLNQNHQYQTAMEQLTGDPRKDGLTTNIKPIDVISYDVSYADSRDKRGIGAVMFNRHYVDKESYVTLSNIRVQDDYVIVGVKIFGTRHPSSLMPCVPTDDVSWFENTQQGLTTLLVWNGVYNGETEITSVDNDDLLSVFYSPVSDQLDSTFITNKPKQQGSVLKLQSLNYDTLKFLIHQNDAMVVFYVAKKNPQYVQ